jgi:hypothetical protein
MTQQSNWDNLMAALESDPNLREALRRHILTEELLNLPSTVANLTKHVETIALAVGQLQTDMTSAKEKIEEVQRAQSIQSGVLSEAAGAAYENMAIRLAPRLFRRHLGFTETALFSHYMGGRHSKLKAMTKAVPDNQTVSAEELEDLLETDLVFTANGPRGQVYVLAEASLTVQANDVIRARRRARILNRLIGNEDTSPWTVAVVMGKAIGEDAQALLIGQEGETGMVTFLMANGDAPDA